MNKTEATHKNTRAPFLVSQCEAVPSYAYSLGEQRMKNYE